MHDTAVSSASCLGTSPGGETRQKPKKLEYDIIFVHALWKSWLIQAMIPANLIIIMGDFTTRHTFYCCYWARNSI